MTTTKPFRFSAGTMGSPVSREVHAGFCEKLRVRSPRLTQIAFIGRFNLDNRHVFVCWLGIARYVVRNPTKDNPLATCSCSCIKSTRDISVTGNSSDAAPNFFFTMLIDTNPALSGIV